MSKRNRIADQATENGTPATGRTRTQPDFQLVADKLDGSGTEVLATVKGSTAAKAVGQLAKQYLSDRFENFRLSKQSYISL